MKKIKLAIIIFILGFQFSAGAADCIGSRAEHGCTGTSVPEIPKSDNNITPQAKEAQSQNMLGTLLGVAGVGVGVMTIAKGEASENGHLIAIGIAAVAAGNFLQGTHGSAGAGAYNTEMSVTDPTKKITTDQWLQKQPSYPEYVKAIDELNKMGYKLNKDGSMTLPNGKTVSAEQSQNPSALSSALGQEVDPAAFKDGLNKLMKVAKDKAKAMAPSQEIDFGGGDSGSNMQASYSMPTGSQQNLNIKTRLPADTKGMAKKAGDSFIGVQDDNIFVMMNRRYELKSNQENFLLNPQQTQMLNKGITK